MGLTERTKLWRTGNSERTRSSPRSNRGCRRRRHTSKGRDELKGWIAEPTPHPRPRYDLLVKLLAGEAVGSATLASEIQRVSRETAAIQKTFEELDRACRRQRPATISGYDKTMYLALRRGLLLVRAQMQWLGEVQDYLATRR